MPTRGKLLGIPRPFVEGSNQLEVIPREKFPQEIQRQKKLDEVTENISEKLGTNVSVKPGKPARIEGDGFESIIVDIGGGPLTKVDIDNLGKAIDTAFPAVGVDNIVIRNT